MKNPLFSFAPTHVVNDVRRFYGGHLFLYRSFWICVYYNTRWSFYPYWDSQIWTSTGGGLITEIYSDDWKRVLEKAEEFIDLRIAADYLPWSNDNFNKTITFSKSMFD